MKKLTLLQFVKESNTIHQNKFDYSKTNYINSQINIEIICPLHGSFFQLPNNHRILKMGCPKCSINIRKINQTKSNLTFIDESLQKHNNFYNYSKTIYSGIHEKIEIICPLHGSFWQEAASHLNGNGCTECKKIKIGNKNRKTIENFISGSNTIHKNKYDYHLFKYIKSHTKGKIICQKHGEFLQNPTNHLNGKGCPKCSYNISNGEIDFLNYINLQEIHRHRYIKPYTVDGYDPTINTIYEFLGDYWHGNPEKYNHNNIHPVIKKSFGEIYSTTMIRLNNLKLLGYNVNYIWESNWNKFKMGILKTPNIIIL